jgi:hypothetical protein
MTHPPQTRYRIENGETKTADGRSTLRIRDTRDDHILVGGFERYELAQQWLALHLHEGGEDDHE